MVAKVSCGKSIKGAIAYNENKVAEGKATCIHSSGFGIDANELSSQEKARRFQRRFDLNKKVKTNTVHISLNFDKSESLTKEKLSLISDRYMELLGFAGQPYLVYQHTDAAHPHVHIVTTNIKETGQRIDLHNIGKVKSEYARKLVEAEFNLVKAENMGKSESIFPVLAQAAYGKTETKRAISNVVRAVVKSYKYSSLIELNVVLKQFKVTADRGYEGTRMFERKGLVYSILDSNGKKIGIPIKASAIYGSPTLKYLEKQFALNNVLKRKSADGLKKKIDDSISHYGATNLTQLKNILTRYDVTVVQRENADGRLYGITYVDKELKVIFNGSDLGKGYSAKGLMEKMAPEQINSPQITLKEEPSQTMTGDHQRLNEIESPDWLKSLLSSDKLDYSNPSHQFKKKKRRRNKGRSL
jgi:hypothetical protein